MDAKAVVQQALESGVALYLKDGKLAYKVRKGEFPETLKALIRSSKADIENYLAAAADAEESGSLPAPTARGAATSVLSYAQERLWAIDRLAGRSPHYNLPFAIELRGDCDAVAIEQAIARIVARHEVLRTQYREQGNDVLQVVAEDYTVPFAQVHVGARDAADQQAELDRLWSAETTHGFDLSRDVLLRSTLIRLEPQRHVLLVNLHHIAADGWSIGLLMREFSRLYTALVKPPVEPLPPLALQYGDYAAWQREHVSGAALEGHLDYWTRQLAGLPQLHSLRTDRPRPPVFTYRGAALESRVERALADRLQQLAQRHNATLFVLMHAAFAVLLQRYSGEREIVIGSAVANREQAEIADLIGCFINMLVFRHEVDAERPFDVLLGAVRERVLDGMSHQQLPFEMLVEKLQPARTLSHGPLFQIALIYQNNVAETLALPGLTIELLERPVSVVKYDLALIVKETPTGLRLSWEYASDLFESDTIARLAANFGVLLETIASASTVPVGTLPMLAREEHVRSERDGAGRRLEITQSPSQRIEVHAAATPDRIAAICNGEHASYAELNARANALAHWLTRRGLGEGALVGVCVERSIDMLVCLLGILKSGAAYVPLDPGYPAARLAHMLEDSKAPLVLTQRRLAAALPSGAADTVCLEDIASELARCDNTNPSQPYAPDALAYVIYTSGSTGVPKGVAVRVGGMSNFLQSMQQEPGFADSDRLLAVTPISFDIHVLELFLPLIAGGTVVIADRETAGDGHKLQQMLAAEHVSVMQATPATWRLLLASDWAGTPDLTILCGGEALDRALAEALLPRSRAVWNLYGPTETTVWSSCARITDANDITIGKPIANTQLHVLNAQRQRQPIGAIGEIWIGGAGVARGYLGRDELTAERFVADPFAAGARMYRTGDFGFWRADGNLVYCERVDGQVKVRGFRIELGEIEHRLRQCSEIETAVVLGDGAGEDRRLVAYVVPKQQTPELDASLRAQLRRDLPDYMIPSVFVPLEALPLTPNGKIDRKALRAPAPARAAEHVPPATETEREVERIWCEFLRLPSVSMNANFFEIGGHSLLGARMVTALNQRFGLALHLKDLFDLTTARDLALHLDLLGLIKQQDSSSATNGSTVFAEETEW